MQFSPSLRAFLGLLSLGLLVGSCVGNDGPTGVGDGALVRIAIQPALIPSAADGSALPIHRIRTVVSRQPDGVALREQRFDVAPTATSWALDVDVPAAGDPTVIVYLYLINVAGDDTEEVQFSGRTPPIAVTSGAVVTGVDADIVRGPLSNLAVTGVTITSAPDTLPEGTTAVLTATVTTGSTAAPAVFWTSLDPAVLTVADSVATGVSPGTVEVVASAGAFADTATVTVIAPPVATVRVSPDSADVQAGQTRTYTVELRDAGGNVLTGRQVFWSTPNPAVATVTQSGVVNAVAPGVTTVRATSEGVFDDAIVRVTAAPTGGGATITWTLSGNGNWSDPTAWSLGRVPQAGDTVRIEQGNGYLVTLDVDATIARLVIGGTSTVIYLGVGDHTLTITGTGVGDELDVHPFGAIEMDNGTVRVDDVRNDGSIYAFGTPSTLEAATIVNNGEIVAVSDAILMISHPTATDFRTSGTLTLESGGSLMLGPNTAMTYQGGTIEETGVLFFQPGSSLLLTNDLSIDGPFILLTGASILQDDTEDLTIGPASTLELVSDVAPAEVEPSLIVDGYLFSIGASSTVADLTIGPTGSVYVDGGTGGGLVTRDVDNSGTIALAGGSETRFGPGDANASITNRAGAGIQLTAGGNRILNGQLINEGDISVTGPSELHRVDAQGAPVVAHHVNVNTGSITLALGGSLDIELGGASPTFTNSGSITVGAGSTLSVTNLANPAGQIITTANASLYGTGTVDVRSGTPTGINNGTIGAGPGIGTLTWMGSIPMGPTGVIQVKLEGTTPGTGHDQINVSAALLLDGTLQVSAPSFVPSDGDRFAVMTFGSRFGNFADIVYPNIQGMTFDTLWTNGQTPDTLYVVASGQGPAALTWTGAISTDWSNAGNWSPAQVPRDFDGVSIPSGPTNQPTLTGSSVASGVTIAGAGARLTVGGQTLTVGSLNTHTDGLLVMTNAADLVNVTGSGAFFQGGDQTGLLSAGELRVAGSFTQQEQTSPSSFRASGTHRTVLTGSTLQSVRFCCTAGAPSGFQELDLSSSAGINIQNGGFGVFVYGTLTSLVGTGPAPRIYMLGTPMTAARFQVDKLIVDRGTLTLNEGGVQASQRFDNVIFENYLTSQTQFAIVATGGASGPRTLTFNNLQFQALTTGNTGRYLNVNAPSGLLTIDLPGASPAGGNGPAFTTTSGGVTVNWP